jgi:hypothetical protein
VPQPQRLTNPHARPSQQGKQEPIPQPITGRLDRRDLLTIERVRDAPLGPQSDPPAAFLPRS